MQKREKITEEVLRRKTKERGWELVGRVDYKNPWTLFTVKCDKGEIFTTYYNCFLNLKSCPCHAKNKKISYDEVKTALEKRDWKLLDDKITDMTKINCECDKKHKVCVPWQSIREEKQCIVCSGYKKYTQEEAEIIVASKGWKLLSKYKSIHSKIICECDNKHIITTKLTRVMNDIGCKYCVGGGRFDYEYIKKYIEDMGYKLLSDEYINATTKMKMQCPNKHIIYRSFNEFRNRINICKECNKKYKYSERTILKFLNENTDYEWKSIDPDWLKLKRKNCQIDAYCEELKVGIEVQGRQHYEFPNFCHKTIEAFNEQQMRDQFKKDRCKEVGVKLLEIKAYDFYRSTESMLNALKELLNVNFILYRERTLCI